MFVALGTLAAALGFFANFNASFLRPSKDKEMWK
jgi:hypothetical protein